MSGAPPRYEKRLDDFAPLGATAFWELDGSLRFSFVSDRFEEITGLPRDEVVGDGYEALHLPIVDDADRWRHHMQDLHERNDFREVNLALRLPDGERRELRCSGQALFDAQGTFEGYRGACLDVTVEVRACEEAQSTKGAFLGAIESLTEAVILHDAQDRLVLCNSLYREIHFYNYDLLVPGSRFEGRVRESVQREAMPDAVGRERAWIEERLARHREPCGVYQQRLDNGRWLQISERRTADGGYVGVHADITDMRHRHEEVRLSRERLRNLAERLQEVREQERAAMAREIHDELGQAITGMKMDLAIIRESVPVEETFATERVHALDSLLDETIDTVRRLARRLRLGSLDDIGLQAAIEAQAREFTVRTGCECRCELRAKELVPDHDRDTAVFRIFQEALTNVTRHAQASRVLVRLWVNEMNELLLEVLDNGRGICQENVADTHSLGIIGMRERGGALGGRVYLDPMPVRGTMVRLWLPLGPPRRRVWRK
jgi:PAS domain S-box-containing protein